MRIAVILTVHNRKEKTLKCLEALYEENCDAELCCYMTDDGCTDGTAEAVSDLFQQVNIVKGDGTLFWNRGMWKAWEAAEKRDYDFYLWLNDDTILIENAISRLLKAAEETKHKSIIVGSTCASSNDNSLTYGGRGGDKKHTIIAPDTNRLVECVTFNGNIVLIPRKIFKFVGKNDFFYRHSFGDIDYGLCVYKAGFKTYIAPGFYGFCERNNPIPIFRRKQYSLIKRYKLLYSPLGFNPFEDFYLNKKYYPLWKCCLWFIKLHINVLFPKDHTKYLNEHINFVYNIPSSRH